MAILEQPGVYDELVEMLAQSADADQVLGFRLSSEKQARLDQLLDKNRDGSLSSAESAELDAYEQFEHVVRMLKARIRRKGES